MQKTKSFIFICLGCFLIIGLLKCSALNASPSNITIYVDNKPLVSATSPFIKEGVTLVPMRLIFESLGAEVGWSPETQTIIAKKNATSITLTLGKKIAFIDVHKKDLLLPPMLKNGITYVPLRFISESLGATVEWDEKQRAVFIHSNATYDFSTRSKQLSIQEIGKMEKAIVFIYNHATNGNDTFGSGFFISNDGTIVTNYHVIAHSKKLSIYTDTNKEYTDITVLGYDVLKDIAILKINTQDKFPFCKIGDSNKIVLGDSIVVIGNPMGLRNTLSTGIISSLKQKDFIQITAPISPGSSGGALFNMYGEVIGITSSAILAGQNLGFCIPINEIHTIALNKPLTPTQLSQTKSQLEAPQNVRAFPLSSSEIALQWDYNPIIDYYYVYFCDTVDGEFIPFLDDYDYKKKFDWIESYSMSNYDLPAKTKIYYRVTAVKNGAESPVSQTVSATTFADDPTSLIDTVREGSFNQFPNQKIGSNFNTFFNKPTWTYFRSLQEEHVIEFTGTYITNHKETSLLVQFIVNASLDSFRATYMERDNYPMTTYEFEDLMKTIFNK